MAGGAGRIVRVGVIGCGAIADEHLPFLAESPQIALAAVCDVSPALATIARDRYGAERADTDIDLMLDEVRPDVVHVLTPPRTHADLVRRCLERGAHVICEKPLAPDSARTRELLALASERGRVLVETRNLLYNDVVRVLDRAVANGQVGEVREVDVSLTLDLGAADLGGESLELPAGIAHDYLPHLAYLLLHFAPDLADRDGTELVGWLRNRSGRPEIGVDHIDALITGERVRARLRISPDVVPDSLRVALRGTAGSLEADLYQPYVRREGPPWVGKGAPFGLAVEGVGLIRAGLRNVAHRLTDHTTYHGMPRMLGEVYEALRSGKPGPIRESDLVASADLIDRIVTLGRKS